MDFDGWMLFGWFWLFEDLRLIRRGQEGNVPERDPKRGTERVLIATVATDVYPISSNDMLFP